MYGRERENQGECFLLPMWSVDSRTEDHPIPHRHLHAPRHIYIVRRGLIAFSRANCIDGRQ